jgi:hypothetical protein
MAAIQSQEMDCFQRRRDVEQAVLSEHIYQDNVGQFSQVISIETHRQTGHVPLDLSHGTIHDS